MNWEATASEVADELRTITDRLLTADVEATVLTACKASLRDVSRLLHGPPKPHPSDQHPDHSVEEAYAAYRAKSMFGGGYNPLSVPTTTSRETASDGTPVFVVKLTLPVAYEGGRGVAHGGYVAALFDDVLGNAQRLHDVMAATASLTVHYRKPTPLFTELTFRAWYDDFDGRKVRGKATCHAGSTLTAEAEGLFVKIDVHRMGSDSRR